MLFYIMHIIEQLLVENPCYNLASKNIDIYIYCMEQNIVKNPKYCMDQSISTTAIDELIQ